ncbi:MAG TPA: SDR family oxidoreductase [Acidimicrobiales bacterium]|jgi:NAD(P)-dependent dehydrogenase (short-subunit alcohol dehydrogenase family)|nr:SDR family oxidoreductase [Acidimicrobiales bacterium]
MPVALVTGASRGLGRAISASLALDGWDLVVDGRRPEPLHEVATGLRRLGSRVEAVAGDVADPAHRVTLIAAAERFGSLDLLVNNASTLGPSPLPSLGRYPIDALRHVYEVNVVAPVALLQSALPLLRAARGTVLAISSDAAVEAYEGWGGYGSSKAALDQVHAVLAVEEPELYVYRFDPGDMRTDMHQDAFPGEDISDRPLPESVTPAMRDLIGSGAPSGRYRVGDLVPS